MNCEQLTQLLDTHGPALLHDATLGAAALTHGAACRDCHAVLTATRALANDSIPFPVTLEQRIARLAAGRRPRAAASRFWLVAAIVGGGFAAAATGWYLAEPARTDDGDFAAGIDPIAPTDDPTADGTTAADHTDAANAIASFIEAEESRAVENWSASVLAGLPDGDYFALLRVPPKYPSAAAERGLEGEAVSEFAITATGDVIDVTIVRSSDPVFEASAIDASLRTKYKPRVVDGRGVEVSGVRNLYRFQLQEPQVPPTPAREEGAGSADRDAGGDTGPASGGNRSGGPDGGIDRDTNPAADGLVPGDTAASDLDAERFSTELAATNACLEAGDLRCMELELDRIMATYRLSPQQTSRLWHIYGFIHHRRGRYELALEAYRNAASEATVDASYLSVFPLMIVAYIHFELGQYQEAMNAVSEYVRLSRNPQAVDYVFIDRLESLGAVAPPVAGTVSPATPPAAASAARQ